MLNNYLRSGLYNELSSEERQRWFSLKEKAVSHHIDSLYYSVFIEDDFSGNDSKEMVSMLDELTALKVQAVESAEAINLCDLTVCPNGLSIGAGMYAFHLSNPEIYDVFISPYLPNDDTPRIQVQLRTRGLLFEGLESIIMESYNKVGEILSSYGLRVRKCIENRIDYAYHTNVLQKPIEEFEDSYIKKHLQTVFTRAGKEYDLRGLNEDKLEVDYFTLGRRKSKKLFFRAYEKTKEVIQQNYKPFFFLRWYERGLISEYDKFVYEEAYRLHSFRTGILVGRIKWYLEHGKDEERKEKYINLLETCNIKSDNNKHIEEEIKGFLPEPTTIINIEFETKRKFYHDAESSLGLNEEATILVNESDIDIERNLEMGYYPRPLRRLFRVLSRRKVILEYLTSYCVNFVKDKKEVPADPVDWWNRIHRARIDDSPKNEKRELYYTYSNNLDRERMKNKVLKNVATLGIYARGNVEESSFAEDLWDSLTLINDNDMHDLETFHKTFGQIQPKGYEELQRKRSRQLKRIIQKAEEAAERYNMSQLEGLSKEEVKEAYDEISAEVERKLDYFKKKSSVNDFRRDKRRCRICNKYFPKVDLEDYNSDKGGGLCPECVKIPLADTKI